MKKLSFVFIILYFACTSHKGKIITEESPILKTNYTKIKIPSKYDNLLQIDSIFDTICITPLETNKNCLISSVNKVLINNDLVYIQNQRDNLYVFSIDGKFIREIGKKGKGPGEFMELRDFDIDNDGNVYILDFRKIQKYSSKGRFLEKYRFEFAPNDMIHCNPLQFALCEKNNFYIWGGSFGIHENKNKNLFLMYKMNKKGEILERYFPLKYNVVHNHNQFSKFMERYDIVPWYGSNIIYSVSNESVRTRYMIDFGDHAFRGDVPKGFKSLSEFKAEVDQKYANSISNVVETNDWLYFMFRYKRYVKNVFYSKRLKKTFVSQPYPRVPNRLMPWMIHSTDGIDLFALIEPRIVLDDIKEMKIKTNETKVAQKVMQRSSINDNPVLFRCKMKKYNQNEEK